LSNRIELTAGGRVRRFALRLPRPRSSGGIPLVIVLHGNHPDATGLMMRDWTTFDEQADVSGFAVAYPDGVGGCWADGHGVTAADEAGVDDVAFLRALVGTSAERYGTFVARRQVVPRGSAGSGGDNPPEPARGRDRPPGVRRRRGDLPLRRAAARARPEPAALTRRPLCWARGVVARRLWPSPRPPSPGPDALSRRLRRVY
jgi:hypothetical protein